ncbi:type VI secretion system baseplate subunit TssG, partial [Klebsiella pneumoniae]|uniref:type VI secretion system baseplate subunit TssG n=1 Tax=Klebsiella pneumoniae TaxID=573 RepID=UPI001D0F14BA
MINLVYRVWRKYRYYVRFQPGAQDVFSAQLFALVGLGDPDLRGETPINWCKMLAYAGTLAGRSRSPQVVAGIIAHCFDLPDVSIRQWVRRRVSIDRSQQLALGKQNARLG